MAVGILLKKIYQAKTKKQKKDYNLFSLHQQINFHVYFLTRTHFLIQIIFKRIFLCNLNSAQCVQSGNMHSPGNKHVQIVFHADMPRIQYRRILSKKKIAEFRVTCFISNICFIVFCLFFLIFTFIFLQKKNSCYEKKKK